MTIPPLAFQINGRDKSGPAFKSARRNIGDTRRAVGLMNADVKLASSQLVGFGKSALLGATGLVSMAAAVAKMKTGLEQFDRIAKVARQNGLDGRFYQTLAFMAGEASVEISVLDNALRKFTVGVGEARNGTGTLYTELKRADQALLDQVLSAETAEDRLRIYANAVQNAADAEERAALVKAAFGQRGADLVRVLELGAGAMDTAGQKAQGLGNIIEDNVLDQAEDMQNRLGNAADALDKQLNAALIEAAPLMVNFYENMAAVVRVSRDWSTALDDIPGKLNEIGNSSVFRDLVDLMDSAGLIDRDAIDAINRRLNGGAGPVADSTASNGFRTVGSFGGPAGRIAAGFDLFPDRSVSATSAPEAFSSINVFKAERMALAELTSELDNTSRAHRDAASVFREAEGAARDLTKGFETAQEQGAALGAALQSATSGLVSDLMNGVDAMDALKAAGIRVAQQFIEMQLQAARFNSIAGSNRLGGGANPLSLLFGGFRGFFADGGVLGNGEWGIAGENGPEPVVGPAQIVSNASMRALSNPDAGANTGGVVTIHNTFELKGTVTQRDVQAMIDRGNAQSVATIKSALPGMQVRMRADGALA